MGPMLPYIAAPWILWVLYNDCYFFVAPRTWSMFNPSDLWSIPFKNDQRPDPFPLRKRQQWHRQGSEACAVGAVGPARTSVCIQKNGPLPHICCTFSLFLYDLLYMSYIYIYILYQFYNGNELS